jgi:hypothetical protein
MGEKDAERFNEFYNAMDEVIKVSLARTNLVKLADDLE